MTSNNQQDGTKLSLADLDINGFSLEELLDFSRAAESRVKAATEQETIRLEAEQDEHVLAMTGYTIAQGTHVETAIWAGYRSKPRLVTIGGRTYSVTVSAADVKRKAELGVAKAEKQAARADDAPATAGE